MSGKCSLHLAELLSSRVCHDFASALGTVTNSVQIARDGAKMDTEALDLAAEAAMGMVHRLRLLRAAWGGDTDTMTVADLRKFSTGVSRGRLRVDLDGIDPGASFAADAARLVLNVMMLGAECLPHGGVIAFQGDGQRELMVSITGPSAAWTQGFPICLTGPEAAWAHLAQEAESQIGGLQCALTALIAHDSGLGISVLMAGKAEAAPPLLLRLSRQDRSPISMA